MKPRFLFWTMSLVIALLAVACAPAAPTEGLVEPAAPVDQPTATEAVIPTAEANVDAPTEVPAVQPIVTPRGDALEATDPSTVSLASGQLQLVEFFRFT
ncbi:MAG: hypothetical protein JNK32_09750 [Anaerolineales bacterium]|nr:hypothetical protein [Anaerolineales bacterium]